MHAGKQCNDRRFKKNEIIQIMTKDDKITTFGCVCFMVGITILIIMLGIFAWNAYRWVGMIILFSSLLTIVGTSVIIAMPFMKKD